MEFLRHSGAQIAHLLREISHLNNEVILLFVLIVIAIILLDSFTLAARRKRIRAGIKKSQQKLSFEGSEQEPVKEYVSPELGLAGRPDAILSENTFLIPVEVKPLARRVRDRYVAQLLVFVRLIEFNEGVRPPYGYLILGPESRRIKIENTEARQKWLSSIIAEMREIAAGGPALPAPHFIKCGKCDVAGVCQFAAKQAHPKQTGRSKKNSTFNVL